jgi:pimeloyl-ACP methyl ester carboxylesterase
MKNFKSFVAATISLLSAMLLAADAVADTAKPAMARNVVLLHGAWADGSSWADVIPRLQAAGLHVTAVQNPLTSLADAVKAAKWVLAQQDGPTVLVGHSWSGTLVSEVGTDPKISALVYVAARAPDAGEDFVALQAKFPNTPARAGVENHDGVTVLSEDAYVKYFAGDIPVARARALYATQQPTAATLFAEKTDAAAWHDKPTFYAVSTRDQTISPEFERFLAKRMGAKTVEVPASHLSMISHAKEIADLILAAAGRGK